MNRKAMLHCFLYDLAIESLVALIYRNLGENVK
jgi:hypothetical protein